MNPRKFSRLIRYLLLLITSALTMLTHAAGPGTGTGLQGEYFNNTSLSAPSVLIRTDAVINNDFVYQSPAPGIVNPEHYSVRWSGKLQPLYSETYTFYTLADDGVRLWINGVLLIDNWVNQGATEKTGSITLAAGRQYDISMDYYQAAGFAVSKLLWSSASNPKEIIPTAQLYPPLSFGTGLKAEYFNNIQLTAPPVLTRVDPAINNSFVYASPAPGIVNVENYAVRWTGQVKPFLTATHTFYTVADDGIRLWVNGVKLIDNWVNQDATEKSGSIMLQANQKYDMVVEYYQASGFAVSKLLWSGAGFPKEIIPTTQLYPTPVVLPPTPACTNNVLPADGTTLGTFNTATMAWRSVPGATAYDVYIWEGATAPDFPSALIDDTTFDVTNFHTGANYHWYVVPENAAGIATGCASNTTSFTMATPGPIPACVNNTDPANGTTITTSATATLSWQAAVTATSYDVYLWTGQTIPAVATANVTTNSFGASGLSAATLYNWYVVPRNASGAAVNCTGNKTSFTTAVTPVVSGSGLQGGYFNNATLTPPSVLTRTDAVINNDFVYVSPAPGIVNLEKYSVRWTGYVQPLFSETYTFYANTDDGARLWVNGVQLIDNWVNQGATEKSGTISLVAGQKYSIVMEYYQATGFAVSKLLWSSPSTIKAIIPASQLYPAAILLYPPSCTINLSPANNSFINTANTATITWRAAETATSYDVYLWAGADAPATPTMNVTATSYQADNLTAATAYKWYIVPRNASGTSDGCYINIGTGSYGTFTFTTAQANPAVPACAVNSRPLPFSTLSTPNYANLIWSTVPYATSYDVYIWSGAVQPATPLVNVAATLFTQTYGVNGLTAGTSYKWFIVPKNAIGAAVGCDVSAVTSFTTSSTPTPACVANVSPLNGAVISSANSVTLAWGIVDFATSYDVYIWTGATAPVAALANVTTTSYNATGLTASTLYNWSIVPKNPAISVLGCSISQFNFYTPATVNGTGIRQADNSHADLQTGLLPGKEAAAPAALYITATISPNPARTGWLTTLLIKSNKAGAVIINTISSNGTLLNAKKAMLVAGVNTNQVNTNGFARGSYIISITGGSKPLNLKLVVE